MRPKLIAFDIYDTRVDIQEKTNPYKTALSKLGLEDIRKELGYTLVTSSKSFEETLPQEAKNHPDYKAILQEVEQNIKKEKDSIAIFPDFLPTIEKLKQQGYKTAVVSNLVKTYAEILDNPLLKGVFDYKVLSFEVGSRKPEKEIFKFLEKKSGYQGQEIVMVGDNIISDIQGAKQAGLQAIHLDRKKEYHNPQNTTINSLEELLEILRY